MTGFTTITAAKIQDAAGNLLGSGRISFFPVTNSGAPVSFTAGGGTVISKPVSFIVTNGAIAGAVGGGLVQVADTTLTNPVNVGYRVTIQDATGAEVQGPGYNCVQPSGATWSLDTYVPSQPALGAIQVGPVRPHTGAWIETVLGTGIATAMPGSPPHGGVD